MRLSTLLDLQAHTNDTPSINKKIKHSGFHITIERSKGSQRTLFDKDGKLVYSKRMFHDYGYFTNTKGRDGDDVDVFVGPVKDSKEVYVVHMKDMGPDKKAREDEDKCFVGFPSADAARQAFLLHYPKNFFESMTVMPLDLFKKKLKIAKKPHMTKKLHAAAKPKCPHCGSSKYTLMPTDFETAKCKDCGKTWNHGIVPGINNPGKKFKAEVGKVKHIVTCPSCKCMNSSKMTTCKACGMEMNK